MTAQHDERTDEAPTLTGLWAEHWRVILLSSVASLGALVVVFLLSSAAAGVTTVRAVGVQLLLMSVVLPVAAVGGRTRMEVLCRGGAVNDAFGAGVLAVAMWSEAFNWLAALKVYLLVSTVGLVSLGVFWAVREVCAVRNAARMPSLAAGATAVALWALTFHFPSAGAATEPESVAGRIAANSNLYSAVADSVGVRPATGPWYSVLAVLGAAAGLAWTAPLVMRSASPGTETDEGDPPNDSS